MQLHWSCLGNWQKKTPDKKKLNSALLGAIGKTDNGDSDWKSQEDSAMCGGVIPA
jgi:hypothetical protein